jgi:hypothetical protein
MGTLDRRGTSSGMGCENGATMEWTEFHATFREAATRGRDRDGLSPVGADGRRGRRPPDWHRRPGFGAPCARQWAGYGYIRATRPIDPNYAAPRLAVVSSASAVVAIGLVVLEGTGNWPLIADVLGLGALSSAIAATTASIALLARRSLSRRARLYLVVGALPTLLIVFGILYFFLWVIPDLS